MDKEYTASEAKAWLNGYDSGLDHGKRIHGNPTKLMMPNMEQTLASFGFYKKKEWVGLTKEETIEFQKWVSELVFKVEQALKEKNNGNN